MAWSRERALKRKRTTGPRRLISERVAKALWSEWEEHDRRMLLTQVHALAKRQDLEPPPLAEIVEMRDRTWRQIPGVWRYIVRVWLTSWEGP